MRCKVRFNLRKSFLLILAGSIAACSANDMSREKWHNFSKQDTKIADIDEDKAAFIFYRTPNIPSPAIEIYINGNYQTSLLDTGVSKIEVCAERNLISADYVNRQHFSEHKTSIEIDAPAQQITYIKVTSTVDQPQLTIIDEKQAQQDILSYPQQVNTLSRVMSTNCAIKSY